MNIDIAVVTDAIPNNKYSLKNLEGHKRIDIIMRNALAALRNGPAPVEQFHAVFTQGGILSLHRIDYDYDTLDEIALAAVLQKNWDRHFTEIDFNEFLQQYARRTAIILQKDAPPFSTIPFKGDAIAFLGAKLDIPEDYLNAVETTLTTVHASLGEMELLASQAIGIMRILLEDSGK